jgi:hypothetical protein
VLLFFGIEALSGAERRVDWRVGLVSEYGEPGGVSGSAEWFICKASQRHGSERREKETEKEHGAGAKDSAGWEVAGGFSPRLGPRNRSSAQSECRLDILMER